MSWSSLPNDLVMHILGKLSVTELAPVTMTCSRFHALYRERMAREQEARLQLAVNCFGADRIACLCALIVRLHKGEPWGPPIVASSYYRCWISGDGELLERRSSPHAATPQDIRVTLKHLSTCLHVQVRPRDLGPYWLSIGIGHHVKRTGIDVWDDVNLMPAALMQALLSGGLARSILDVGFQVEISVGRSGVQIAPLLPFAPRYVPEKATLSGYVKEYMVIGVSVE